MRETAHSVKAPSRGRKTVAQRLQELVKQQARLEDQQKALAAQLRAEERKREQQVEGMIGAACRADAATHEVVKAALLRRFQDPKRRAFLKAEGWM